MSDDEYLEPLVPEVVHEQRDGFCTGCRQLGEPVEWVLAEDRGHSDEIDVLPRGD